MNRYLFGGIAIAVALSSFAAGVVNRVTLIAAAQSSPTAQTIPKIVTPPPAAALAPATTTDLFAGDEILERACSCESWGDPNHVPRQFNADGSILWGQETDPKTGKTIVVKRDVGACQDNTKAHGTEIAALGLNVITSYDDNVAYAKILQARAGMEPWSASQSCWQQ